MSPRIAIAKSRVYRGGVFQVVAHIVEICNELGVVPDIVTMRSDLAAKDVERNYGENVRLNFRKVLPNLRLPYEWHFLYFNVLARPVLRKYDLIINSSNTSFLSGSKNRTISYVHYPRKERVLSQSRDLHIPEGPAKSPLDIRRDPFFLARMLYRSDRGSYRGETVVANSLFTRSAVLRNYLLDESDVSVVYPPVEVPRAVGSSDKCSNLVSTLGRFSPEKRQLEQIEIASRLPDLQFSVMGFTGNSRYFQACVDVVRSRGIANVTLLPDLSYSEAQGILRASTYFLHSVRNEPFGITSVQAIAAGAIPIVHDSGGQREIVPIGSLRYATIDQAVRLLDQLSKEPARHEELRRGLVANAQNFSSAAFKARMKPMIERFLS